MKKLFVAATLLLFTITLSACSLTGNSVNELTSLFDSREDVYAFSAVSAVSAMGELSVQTTTQTSYVPLNETTEQPNVLEDIEALEPYLKLIETFMANDGVSVTVEPSTLEGYEEVMIISAVDIDGEMITYELHYNVISSEVEVDDDDDDADEEDIDEEEEELEIENQLEGILVFGDASYNFTASQEIEEGEEYFEMIAYLTESDYITIEYGTETEDGESETEFLLEIYQNYELIKSTEIEFELENDETEMNLVFVEGSNVARYEFEIKEENNEQKIEIDYEIVENDVLVEEGSIEIIVTFDPVTGATTVSYEIYTSDGEESTVVERDYDDDDEDDEDDDYNDDEETETVF
jgi:hypothetical protein